MFTLSSNLVSIALSTIVMVLILLMLLVGGISSKTGTVLLPTIIVLTIIELVLNIIKEDLFAVALESIMIGLFFFIFVHRQNE